jgi:hypothetical protein
MSALAATQPSDQEGFLPEPGDPYDLRGFDTLREGKVFSCMLSFVLILSSFDSNNLHPLGSVRRYTRARPDGKFYICTLEGEGPATGPGRDRSRLFMLLEDIEPRLSPRTLDDASTLYDQDKDLLVWRSWGAPGSVPVSISGRSSRSSDEWEYVQLRLKQYVLMLQGISVLDNAYRLFLFMQMEGYRK